MKKILTVIFCLLTAAPYASDNFTMGDWNREFYEYYLSALAHEKNADYNGALESYLKALAIYPESQVIKEDAVIAALRANKPELVESFVEDLALADTFHALAAYAQYAWSKGNLQTAVEYYERALQLQPLNAGVFRQYSVLLGQTNPQRLLAALKKLAADYPEAAPMAHLEMGNLYLSSGDIKNALASYDKVSALAPDAPEPYFIRAEVYQRAKAYAAALNEYGALKKMGRADAEVLGKIGSLNIVLQNIPAAKAAFGEILLSAPDNPEANAFMAVIAEDEGDFAAALKYTMASSDFKADFARRRAAAFYAVQAGKPELAAEIFRDAWLDTKSTEAGFYYAVTLQDDNNHKEAVKIFEKVLKQSPDYTRAKMRLALTYSTLGADRKFYKLIKPLLEAHPEDDFLLNLYAYHLAEANKDLALAENLIKRALALRPGEPAYMDTYGWLLYRKGDIDGALDWLEKAAADAGGDAEIAGHLEQVYKIKNKTNEVKNARND